MSTNFSLLLPLRRKNPNYGGRVCNPTTSAFNRTGQKRKKKEISQEPKVLSGRKDGFSVGASQMRGSDKLRLVLKRTHVLFCQAGSFPSQRINATCQKSPTCCQASEWCVGRGGAEVKGGGGGQQIMSGNFRGLLAFFCILISEEAGGHG